VLEGAEAVLCVVVAGFGVVEGLEATKVVVVVAVVEA
jgi:hypothetical protein